MARREYTAGLPTTLASAFNSGDATFTVTAATNWPTSTDYDFFVTIDGGTAQEERVLCSARTGTSVTVATSGRGKDGTGEKNHAAGATVWPSWSAQDADEANAHIESTGYASFSKPVHGIGSGEGVVVGTTKEQTLTNKTLASPIITGTISGTGVISSTNILDGTIVDADISAGAAIVASKLTGVVTPTSTDTLTNKTLTSPIINGTVTGTAFGAWTAYTPVWGSNGTQPVLGNSTISGAFTQVGKTVHYRITLTLASGGGFSVGTGSRYTFILPVTGVANYYPMATGFYHDSSASTWYPIWGRVTTNAIDAMWIEPGPKGLTSGTLGSALPVVPATGDIYFLSGTYEAA